MVSLHLCICLDIWYRKSTQKANFSSFHNWFNLRPTFIKQLNSIKYSSINIYNFYCKHFLIRSMLIAIIYNYDRFQVLEEGECRLQSSGMLYHVVSCFSLWFILQCSHYLTLHAADCVNGELGRTGCTCGLSYTILVYAWKAREDTQKNLTQTASTQ